MAGRKGFLYESHIYKILYNENLTKSKYKPSFSDNTKPDTAFVYNNDAYNLELKLDLDVDFGQGTLRYDFTNKKWFTFAESNKMKELLDFYEIEKFANSQWKKEPNKVGKNDIGGVEKKLTQKEISEDYKNFPDKYMRLPGSNPIAEYYNSKNVYYIQIGKLHGFYYLGKDIAGLGVPEFKPSEQKIRIRRKGSGGGNYRFTTALQINKTSLQKSDFDLDVNVDFLKT
jgi:hypothetical protein